MAISAEWGKKRQSVAHCTLKVIYGNHIIKFVSRKMKNYPYVRQLPEPERKRILVSQLATTSRVASR